MTDNLNDELRIRMDTATEIIHAAGTLAMTYFDHLSALAVRSKGVQDVVSDADVTVERLIRERLAAAFPTDAFLGEETGHTDFPGATGIWVVDPIDGTQPFVNGLRSWCVSMAYVRGTTVHLGLVNNPAAGELFLGGIHHPATLNGTLIAPSASRSVSDGLTFLGCSNRVGPDIVVPVLERLLRAHGMFVRSGSGALGLCDVACGRLIGYIEPHINSWDCLGAVAVLNAAGCQISDYLTHETLLTGNKIVASTPAIFNELVAILN